MGKKAKTGDRQKVAATVVDKGRRVLVLTARGKRRLQWEKP